MKLKYKIILVVVVWLFAIGYSFLDHFELTRYIPAQIDGALEVVDYGFATIFTIKLIGKEIKELLPMLTRKGKQDGN